MADNKDVDNMINSQISLFTDAELKKMERGENHGKQQCDSNRLC